MKTLTSKGFIDNVNFEYFETYSWQRSGEFEIYENLLIRYKTNSDSLSKEEETELNKLRKLNLYTQHNNFIFTDNKILNETAELVFKSEGLNNLNKELIEILKIPFIGNDAWMCPPIYRDAILFYDNKNKLIRLDRKSVV